MKALCNSFRWAAQGFVQCLRTQRNLRIHLAAAALALWFGRCFGLSVTQFALLWLTIGFVIAAELFNTAAERLVDFVCPQHDSRAGFIKDVAAAAVLVAAVTAVGVGISLFWQPAQWRQMLEHPRQLVIPAAIAVVGICAVFGLPYNEKKTINQNDKEQE